MTELKSLTPEQKLELVDQIAAREDQWQEQPLLTSLAQDPDALVRERAISLLWDVVDSALIDILLQTAGCDPVLEVRCAAISALGRYVYEGYVMENLEERDFERVRDALLRLHRNRSEPLAVRRSAIEALGFITEEEIEDVIRAAYRSDELEMKMSALFAMGRSGTRTWDDILEGEMRGSDPALRFEATRAAGATFMTRAADLLEQLTSDTDRDVQLAAIEALGKAGRPNSRGLLRRLAASRDEDVRDAAEAALHEFDIWEDIDNSADER